MAIRICFFALAVSLTGIAGADDTVQLARTGQPLAEIVIAPVATRSARFGALELQGHLKAITGADFAIVTPTNRTAGRLPIYVGDSAPARTIAPDLTALAKSELLVLTRPEAIVLAGEDEPDFCTNHPPRLKYHTLSSFDAVEGYPARWSKHGTLDAVYEFLENHCGVNWFDFSDDGTDYVDNPSLAVAVGDRRVRPFANCRNLDMDSELWPHPCDGSYRERVVTFPNAHQPTRWCDAVIYTQREVFRLRRRVSGELECCNHSFYDWYDRFRNTNSPAFVAWHPEYFAKQAKRQNKSAVFIESYYDPSRQPPQLCYSNPEVIRQVIADVRDYFDHGGAPVRDGKGKIVKYKPIWGRDSCALEPMDNDGFCQCARCRAEYPAFVTNTSPWIGTTRNDHWFGFVNKVAREVKKTHPTKRISTLAYMSHTAPPPFPMEDNVVVHFCYTGNRMPHGVSLNARLDAQLLDWVKVLKKGNLGLWFYNCFPHDGVGGQSSEFMCCPGNFLDLHYRQFQKVVKGCEARTGVYYCGSTGELENYAISRWFWNPDEDPETIKRRWFAAYGAAGPAVRNYYEIIEERFTNPAYYPPKAGHQNDCVAWKYLCTAEVEARLADCVNRALSAPGLTPRQRARRERWYQGTAVYVLSGPRMARPCNNQREGVVATRTLYKFRPIEPLARDVLSGAETLGCVLRDDRSAGGLVLRTPVLTNGAITNEVFADPPGKGITNILLAVHKPIDDLRRFRVIVSRRDPQRGRSAFAPVGRVNGRWIDLAGEQLIRKWTDDAVDTYDVFEFLFTPESAPAHLEGIGIRDFSAAVRHSATRFALLEAECAAADDLDEESVKIDFLAHGNDRVFLRVSVPDAEVIEPVGGIHFMVNPALWTKAHPKWQTMRVRVKSADGRELVKAVRFGIARLNGKLQVIRRADKIRLAENGHPLAKIVVGARPTKAAWFGAFELQHHLRQITGAEFEILNHEPRTATCIYIGESALAKGATAAFERQEYVVDIRTNAIMLAGFDGEDYGRPSYSVVDGNVVYGEQPDAYAPQGSLYAVYDFLERCCGVRWCNATDFGTVVPRNPNLTVALGSVRRKPSFAFRGGSAAYGASSLSWPASTPQARRFNEMGYANIKSESKNRRLFALRHCAGGDKAPVNHSFYHFYDLYWLTNSSTFCEYRPEIFAQGYASDQHSLPPQLCYSHPRTVETVVSEIRRYFDHGGFARPCRNVPSKGWAWGEDGFALEPMDNTSFCKCEACSRQYEPGRRLDNSEHSTHWFRFVNAVAREIRKTHPTKKLRTLAYFSHEGLPTNLRLEDNVQVYFCLSNNRESPQSAGYAAQCGRLQEWHRSYPRMTLGAWLYDIFPLEPAINGGYKCVPGYFAHECAKQFRFLREHGVGNVYHCGFNGEVCQYVSYALMFDADRSVDDLLDEYFSLYGAAAHPLRQFYEIVERRWCDPELRKGNLSIRNAKRHWGVICPPETMRRLAELIAEAQALASTPRERRLVELFAISEWEWMKEGSESYILRSAAPLPKWTAKRLSPIADGDLERVDWSALPQIKTPLYHRGGTNVMAEIGFALRLAHDGKFFYLEVEQRRDLAKANVVGHETTGPRDNLEFVVARQRSLPYRWYHARPGVPMFASSYGEVNFRNHVLSKETCGDPAYFARTKDLVRDPDLWTQRFAFPLSSLADAPLQPGATFYLTPCLCGNSRLLKVSGGAYCVFSPVSFATVHTIDRSAAVALEK